MKDCHGKADLAVNRQQDDLARAALGRSLSHQNLANSFTQQLEDQTTEAETLRSAFAKLQQKLQETQATCEMLVAQHHRARVIGKANTARAIAGAQHKSSTLNRLRSSIVQHEAANMAAHSILEDDTLDDKSPPTHRHAPVTPLLPALNNHHP